MDIIRTILMEEKFIQQHKTNNDTDKNKFETSDGKNEIEMEHEKTESKLELSIQTLLPEDTQYYKCIISLKSIDLKKNIEIFEYETTYLVEYENSKEIMSLNTEEKAQLFGKTLFNDEVLSQIKSILQRAGINGVLLKKI